MSSKRRFLIADIETSPFLETKEDYILTPLFMCIQDFESEEFLPTITDFDSQIREFFREITDIKCYTTVYYHNLDFDLKFIFDKLPLDSYKVQIIPVGGKIAEIRLYREYKRKDGRTYTKTALRIRDSLVLLLSSLEKIGNSLKFPKGKINYGLEITEEYIEYCRQDCRIVTKALKQLITFTQDHFGFDISIDMLPLTLPALAKKTWGKLIQEEFPQIPYKFYFAKEYINEKYRPFYYGGRVEVFDFNICKNGFYNDVNSFYGSIMYDYEFPIPPYREFKCVDGETCWAMWKEDKTFFGAICEVTEDLDIPVIPTRIESGKIIYPTGKKICFLFREEIEYLLSLKQKVTLRLLVQSSGMLPIFRKFVELTYFERRKLIERGERDSFFAYLLKIFLNALYGKFAERSDKEKITLELLNPDLFQDGEEEIRGEIVEYGEILLVKRIFPVKMFILTNVFFSMRITALCKMILHQSFTPETFYTDTDSIVSQKMIEDSDELGKWKPELIFSKFQAFGCKEYAYEEDRKTVAKMKGFGRETYQSIRDFAVKYLKPHQQRRVTKIKEIMKRKLNPGSVLTIQKLKASFYDKRWIKSNLTTRPLSMDECNNQMDRIIEHNQVMIESIIRRYENGR